MMQSLTLTYDNRADVAAALNGAGWVVACLCAGWCGTCSGYRATFEQLALRHPDKLFVWIDIEDQAEVVGELDIENFPTLLIQQEEVVAFFGTVLPDPALAHRLIEAKSSHSPEELVQLAECGEEKRQWQRDSNLRRLLQVALGAG